MTITMLGTSGSGKTVYMSAMAEAFYHGFEDTKGFMLEGRKGSATTDSFIYAALEEPSRMLYSDRQFPDGTSASKIMPMRLNYKNHYVMDVDWIDYRGGAIAEIARGNITDRNREIQVTLMASDVVLVFIDAAMLKACGSDIRLASRQTGASDISEVLERILEERYVDIIIILSKSDSSTIDRARDIPALKQSIMKMFSRFSQRHPDNDLFEHIIPVGAVGKGNVSTRVQSEGDSGNFRYVISQDIIGNSSLKSQNIVESFAMALKLCVENLDERTMDSKNELATKLTSLENQYNALSRIIDLIFYHSERGRQIKDLRKNLEQSENEIRGLRQYKKILDEMTRGIS